MALGSWMEKSFVYPQISVLSAALQKQLLACKISVPSAAVQKQHSLVARILLCTSSEFINFFFRITERFIFLLNWPAMFKLLAASLMW